MIIFVNRYIIEITTSRQFYFKNTIKFSLQKKIINMFVLINCSTI